MLHARLRPLPRRNPTPIEAAPAPDFQEDTDPDGEEDPEDLFSAFLPYLFPDDAPAFHGDPGQHLAYASPRYGDLEIMVPSYPAQSDKHSEEIAAGLEKKDGEVNQVEEGRRLFAHFLWSAAMVVAEGVEDADFPASEVASASDAKKEARGIWNVEGETVLELGAGAALPSLICALGNASRVTATDHPSSPALAGAIQFNMEHNLRNRSSSTNVTIEPHEWGENKGAFTRIVAADCFWMRSQHENLARTMQWFLAPGGKVWVVVGFHTGRPIVAGFFEIALANGFEIELIFERDLVSRTEDDQEVRRAWMPHREGEGPENRKRWCVISVLKRKGE
ncbi:hypothetical protein N7468_004055 [Penicillium chermesinum]|uniref:Nicotinamide N-methyltransferase n=1 Tax=Penicillium chermesinum TaxID=63820 RepID=A0A9W9TS77_9EURO|nr:uncharacterized protein N7468_004055 [Penicillium chermesinum]KAJ5239436.1 hypothetical protein N7468_004055 [Penicillium chermesinum]